MQEDTFSTRVLFAIRGGESMVDTTIVLELFQGSYSIALQSHCDCLMPLYVICFHPYVFQDGVPEDARLERPTLLSLWCGSGPRLAQC